MGQTRFNNTFDDFRQKRKVGDRTVIGKLIFVQGCFLSIKNITDCLRAGWNSPEFNERLTILVIVGTSMDAHCFSLLFTDL